MKTALPPNFPLQSGRAHEVCGPGAWFFALSLAASLQAASEAGGDTVIWIRESWLAETLSPEGFAHIFPPDHLLVANARDHFEVLALAEEALRSQAVKLVILELQKPIGLTEGRRLHLSAKEGGAIALSIIPEGMGSNAAETRWACRPVFDAQDSTLHEWKLIKNKSGTHGSWNVRWDAQKRCIVMVPPSGE